MRELFFSECRRFRNAALMFALVHLLVQLLVHRMSEVLQMHWQKQALMLVPYMLAALAFALYQFGSYRQPSRWLWLLHRPLAPLAIFAAIASASALLIALAVGLPALLAVVGTDWLSARTVDLRHYLLVLHLVLLTMAAWLSGVCVILSRSRSAIVILLVPYVLLAHLAPAWAMLGPALLCLALLAIAANGVMKPNRTAPPANRLTLVATAVPLQLGFYFALIWIGGIAFQSAQMLAGTHPVTRSVPLAGSETELRRAEGATNFLAALAGSTDPHAALWRRQLPLLKIGVIYPMGHQFPVRGQASNTDEVRWLDAKRHIEFTFSHDAMRFHGLDQRTGGERGWLGTGGLGDTGRFATVPVIPPGLIMTTGQVYRYDSDSGRLAELVRVPAGETLIWPLRKAVGERLYTLTNRRLIFQDKGGADGKPVELFSIALPGPYNDLARIEIAELADGTLLSFDYGRRMEHGGGEAMQTVTFVGPDGTAQVIARRALTHEFPALFEHRYWLASPLLNAVLALPDALLDKGLVPDAGQRVPHAWQATQPPLVIVSALAACVMAALGAWIWGVRRPGWLLVCLLVGLPALFSLVVIRPRAGRANPA